MFKGASQKKIVTIGGGTGSYTLLTGLKKYPYDISAIVTMADDGGSTGVLRDELGVLPPGDVRQCLVALSDSTEMLRKLMNYRFEQGGLEGHSFGNLLLTALEKITGNFSDGIHEATKILDVRGDVLPVSVSDMRLKMILRNGRVINGEKELDENDEIRTVGIRDIRLAKRTHANKKAIAAIKMADVVIIGPGDYYGSIVPNLLLSAISRAIKTSHARVFFIAPLTNKKGQTDGYNVDTYVRAIEKYIGRGRIDNVFYNTKRPHRGARLRYEKKEGRGSCILYDPHADSTRTYDVVLGDFLRRENARTWRGDVIAHTRAFIRHDSVRLAEAVSHVIAHGQDSPVTII